MLRYFLVVLGVVSLLLSATLAQATTYTLTDLGVPSGYVSTTGYAVNNTGQVAIQATDVSGNASAYIYSGGSLSPLGTISTWTTAQKYYPYGINKNGQIIGYAVDTSGTEVGGGFLYSGGVLSGTGLESLGLSGLYGINDSGLAVGTYGNGLGGMYTHGLLLDTATLAVTDLGMSPYYGSASAMGINATGQIAGTIANASGQSNAAIYSGGTWNNLGNLNGPTSRNAYGSAINGSGHVTGYSFTTGTNQNRRAFFDDGTTMTNLGVLGTDNQSRGLGISDGDQVVGYSGSTNTAFVTTGGPNGGTMQNLNTLIPTGTGWYLQFANGISNNGKYITGYGTIGGATHAYLLTAVPVPEPSTMLLVTVGLLGLLAYAWRKRK